MTTHALAVLVAGILFLGFMRLPDWAQTVASFLLLAVILGAIMLVVSAFMTGINVIEVLFNLSKL